jgi:hypothetical protein
MYILNILDSPRKGVSDNGNTTDGLKANTVTIKLEVFNLLLIDNAWGAW